LSPQCGDNLFVGINFRELNHPVQILRGESPAKLLFQLCPQRGHNLRPILRALLFEDVLTNAAANVPVERDQSGIHRPRHLLSRREDESAHIREQWRDAARGLGGNFGEREFLGHGEIRLRDELRRELVAAYKSGDAFAKEVWLRSIRALGCAIGSFVNILDPQAVVIGGGIARSDRSLFGPLQRVLDEVEWRPGGARVKLLSAKLGEFAGAYGAARHASQPS
jgi:hypothetical protein